MQNVFAKLERFLSHKLALYGMFLLKINTENLESYDKFKVCRMYKDALQSTTAIIHIQ